MGEVSDLNVEYMNIKACSGVRRRRCSHFSNISKIPLFTWAGIFN